MLLFDLAGMHRGLRGLAGRNQHYASECAVQSMPRGQDGELADLEHGQDHDSCERGDLCHDRRRGYHLCGSESTPRPEAAHPAQHRSDEDGWSDRRSAGQLLLERGSNAQPRRTVVVDGHPERLQCPKRVGPSVGL